MCRGPETSANDTRKPEGANTAPGEDNSLALGDTPAYGVAGEASKGGEKERHPSPTDTVPADIKTSASKTGEPSKKTLFEEAVSVDSLKKA